MSRTLGPVVVTGARSPVALHLARLLRDAGHDVIVADTFVRPLARAATGVRSMILPAPLDGLAAYAAAWERVLIQEAPRLVVPVCEEVFHLAAVRDVAGVAVPLFAPPLEVLAAAHDKYRFAQDASGFGADPPETALLTSTADLSAITPGTGIVLKPVWSRFGSRTLIRPGRRTLSKVRPDAADPWIAQRLVPGEEICATAVSHNGTVTAFQAYRPVWRAGRGAAVAIQAIENSTARRFTEGFCRAKNWTGQIAFDFKYDGEGCLRVLECNPRPATGVIFFGPDDGLSESLLSGQPASPARTGMYGLPLAMWTYGLSQAVRDGRLRAWNRDRMRMGDLAAYPGEPSAARAQFCALAEIATVSLKTRKGLRRASTEDIEWNGTPFRHGDTCFLTTP